MSTHGRSIPGVFYNAAASATTQDKQILYFMRRNIAYNKEVGLDEVKLYRYSSAPGKRFSTIAQSMDPANKSIIDAFYEQPLSELLGNAGIAQLDRRLINLAGLTNSEVYLKMQLCYLIKNLIWSPEQAVAQFLNRIERGFFTDKRTTDRAKCVLLQFADDNSGDLNSIFNRARCEAIFKGGSHAPHPDVIMELEKILGKIADSSWKSDLEAKIVEYKAYVEKSEGRYWDYGVYPPGSIAEQITLVDVIEQYALDHGYGAVSKAVTSIKKGDGQSITHQSSYMPSANPLEKAMLDYIDDYDSDFFNDNEGFIDYLVQESVSHLVIREFITEIIRGKCDTPALARLQHDVLCGYDGTMLAVFVER